MGTDLVYEIRDHIRHNRTEVAIHNLMQLTQSKSEKLNQAILLSARHYGLKDAIISGIISYDYEVMDRNRINNCVLLICDELDEKYKDEKLDIAFTHILHQFPRSPLVRSDLIDRTLLSSYAENIGDFRQISSKIDEANAFRRLADADAIVINKNRLPPVSTSPAEYYWYDTFREAGLQGPRMVAALLLVVPDDQFSIQARRARQDLIALLKLHK